MNTKRSTPHAKGPPSASKFRTPTNMNSTVSERRGSTSKLGVRSVPDATGNSSVYLSLKPGLSPLVDNDLDSHLGYAEYLQAFLKEEAVEAIVGKHKADMQDQLILQKDKLYKSKLKGRSVKRELNDLDRLEKIQQLVETMEASMSSFTTLSQDADLENTLEQLLEMLSEACNKIRVKNVELIEEEKGFDEFFSAMKKCQEELGKIKSLNVNMESVCELGDLLTKYKKNIQDLRDKQKNVVELQKNFSYMLIENISDMYTQREKY